MSDYTLAEQEALETIAAMLADRRVDSLTVLRALWPNPLTRPLYTIEDMMAQSRRLQPPSEVLPKSERPPAGREAEPWPEAAAPWWLRESEVDNT